MNIRTLALVALALALALALAYLIHLMGNYSNYLESYLKLQGAYNQLLTNYTKLLSKYQELNASLGECEAQLGSAGVELTHSEAIVTNLTLNATLNLAQCNGYSIQGARQVNLQTRGPGYLVINYRLSNPQVINGEVSYYIYIMAQAMPSIPMTAAYTYEGNTYAYEVGQSGQLIIPVLPNATYVINIGFVCYQAYYYPPTNAGQLTSGGIPEYAVINVTYVW
ncbi:hypothetical protein [Vulcanisaeta thermophila]|uniref:hypothetical protein n=1 Tax=Vulcanisaeta thermophila TaxID=867917 RepID=UPI001EE214B4|nr:hypothetical protein [Vulcanisaeta thermophila]